MRNVKGIKIPKLGFELEKLGDLIAWEGPVFSHFVNKNNEQFLFFWADSDDLYNRWLVYKTNDELLKKFFEKSFSNRDLVLSSPDSHLYIIDIDNTIEFRNIFLVSTSEIPNEYLPPERSFFDENQYENYAQKLKNYLEINHIRNRIIYKPIPEESPSLVSEPKSVSNYKKKNSK